MVTLFSVPKAFVGHVGVIQRNALASWSRLPGCEVVLCGNSAGVAEAAREFGAVHIPDVECNSFGTPLLSSIFASVRRVARHPLLTYVNGDIILFSDFLAATRRVHEQNALLVGRRTNLDVLERLDDAAPDWEASLRARALREGVKAPANGIDYMAFGTDSALTKLPPFAVGRPAWDNWFVGRARRLRIPIIDATDVVLAVHQNHDYSHVPRSAGIWEGPEAIENRRLAGWLPNGPFLVHTIDDSTHLLTEHGIVRRPGLRHRLRDVALRGQFILEPTRNLIHNVNVARVTLQSYASSLPYRVRSRLSRLIRGERKPTSTASAPGPNPVVPQPHISGRTACPAQGELKPCAE